LLWSRSGRLDRFDVVFRHRERSKVGRVVRPEPAAPGRLYNVPARGKVGAEGAAEWRNHLREHLPEYMIPSAFVVLPRLPLTPNGKIDRKALPAPDARTEDKAQVAPRNATESALATIWAELLHRPDIGVTDNFFELGGDSLTAVQLVGRIKRDLDRDLPLKRLFELTTIESMATALGAEERTDKRSEDIAAMFELLKEVEYANE
ncbi:MAG: phosphopantetheine-binding protein, partial [Bradyrhizobium sp.]